MKFHPLRQDNPRADEGSAPPADRPVLAFARSEAGEVMRGVAGQASGRRGAADQRTWSVFQARWYVVGAEGPCASLERWPLCAVDSEEQTSIVDREGPTAVDLEERLSSVEHVHEALKSLHGLHFPPWHNSPKRAPEQGQYQ